jgi:hypothetical protein
MNFDPKTSEPPKKFRRSDRKNALALERRVNELEGVNEGLRTKTLRLEERLGLVEHQEEEATAEHLTQLRDANQKVSSKHLHFTQKRQLYDGKNWVFIAEKIYLFYDRKKLISYWYAIKNLFWDKKNRCYN